MGRRVKGDFMMAVGRKYTLLLFLACANFDAREWAQRVKPSDNLIVKEE